MEFHEEQFNTPSLPPPTKSGSYLKKVIGLIFLALICVSTIIYIFNYKKEDIAEKENNVIEPLTLADRDIYVLVDDGNANVIEVAKAFYKQYPNKDVYDFLSVFTTFPDQSSRSFHYPVKNEVSGIGHLIADESKTYGSSGNLIGINFFNDMFNSGGGVSNPEGIKHNFNLITHELEHQWVLYIGDSYCYGNSKCWRFNESSHFSHWVDSAFTRGGQIFYDINGGGVAWTDNKDGTFTKNILSEKGLSPLALYLMGMIPSSEVSNLKFIIPEDYTDYSLTVKAKSVELSINDITARYGARAPSVDQSQKEFKMAYILLLKNGEQAKQEDMDSLIYISDNYPGEWSRQTLGKSFINKKLTE